MLSDQSPISFQDAQPETADVVIIGAGIIGITAAWFLVKDGLSVLVCEKGRVAGEQSSRNHGWVRQQGRDEAELPIMMEAINIWEKFSAEINEDLGFRREGTMFLADTGQDLEEFEQWLKIAKQHQLDTRMLSAKELAGNIEAGEGAWLGALYTPGDGRAEPFIAVPAIARTAQKMGCRIIENCAVRIVEIESGQVSQVVTELGTVRTKAVICAGGAWSSAFLANLGVSLPQLTARGTVVRTGRCEDIFPGCAGSHSFAFRRRQDGGYTLAPGDYLEHFIGTASFRYFFNFLPVLIRHWKGVQFRFGDGLINRLLSTRTWDAEMVTPFERTRVLNPDPCPRALKKIRRDLRRYLPKLANIKFKEAWAGMIDATPDFVPVMDVIPGYPGLYVATGFSGHGFGIGPAAGSIMAKMIQGKEIEYDLSRFRFSRFSDGSPTVIGPAL